MNSPSRMKLDTAKAVGCRWSCFDVIRITRRSQYFVRTLGLQVKFWDTLPTIAGSRIGTNDVVHQQIQRRTGTAAPGAGLADSNVRHATSGALKMRPSDNVTERADVSKRNPAHIRLSTLCPDILTFASAPERARADRGNTKPRITLA
jgi:hypothetical protein